MYRFRFSYALGEILFMNDLTVGNPFKILIHFSLPMLISMIFQQMYNIADSVIAGQFISVDALAAIGAAYPATVLFLAVATGASVGCSVVVSLRYGQKDIAGVKSAVYTAFISLTVLALLLTGLGFAIMKPLLRIIGTPTMIFHFLPALSICLSCRCPVCFPV